MFCCDKNHSALELRFSSDEEAWTSKREMALTHLKMKVWFSCLKVFSLCQEKLSTAAFYSLIVDLLLVKNVASHPGFFKSVDVYVCACYVYSRHSNKSVHVLLTNMIMNSCDERMKAGLLEELFVCDNYWRTLRAFAVNR